ncbi:MAG: SGNH/GDSL hydrolase family protein [candidate division KSB1 bacterium]
MWAQDTSKQPVKLHSFRLAFVMVLGLATILLFLFAEFATRLLWGDEIHVQYTTRALFNKNFYSANTNGWTPNAMGMCAGKTVRINALGLRGPEIALHSNQEKILLLGDSVLFGPAVEEGETIAEILRANTQECIINTAVIGLNSSSYVEVLQYWLQKTKPRRVLVFFCLNDAQNDTSFVQDFSLANEFSRALAQLRSRSKFYMLLKNAISDRSKVYFENDRRFYQPEQPQFEQTLKDFAALQQLCAANEVALDVVLLPYEYQLRNFAQAGIWLPQELLQAQLRAQGINCLAIDFSSFYGSRAKELYLYADGIHLSKRGHQLVAEQLESYLIPMSNFSTKSY